MLMVKLRVKGTSLMLEDLELVMNQHWHQISASDEANDKGTEVSLSVVNKIICFKCSGKGYKASTCPENNKGSAKGGSEKGGTKQKEKRKCYRCNKIGHIMTNCYRDEKNVTKRLANWKSVNASEMAMPAINSGNRISTYFVACVSHQMLNS